MGLDRDELKKCAGCGAWVDGDVCSPACAIVADELRERHERKLREAANTYKARQAARRQQFQSWGPK